MAATPLQPPPEVEPAAGAAAEQPTGLGGTHPGVGAATAAVAAGLPPLQDFAVARADAASASAAIAAVVAPSANAGTPTYRATAADPAAPVDAAAAPSSGAAAAQVGPIVSVLATRAGAHQVTVALHPAALGRVEIRLDRDHGGGLQVAITADRPETLQALRRDQSELHQALDRAGLPMDGRSMSFHLAPSAPEASVAAVPLAAPAGQHPSSPQGHPPQSGSAEGNGAGAGGSGGQPRRGHGHEAEEAAGEPDEAAAQIRWSRFGINITA